MTKTKRMIVDNLCRWFQKSGIKSTGDFTFCTAAAILRCTFCPALLPKCGTMWKTTWLHNVGNIRQKDIKILYMKLPRHTVRTFTYVAQWQYTKCAYAMILLFRCDTVSDVLWNAWRSFAGRPTTAGTEQASLETLVFNIHQNHRVYYVCVQCTVHYPAADGIAFGFLSNSCLPTVPGSLFLGSITKTTM